MGATPIIRGLSWGTAQLGGQGTGFRKSLEILNRVAPDFSVDLLARRPEDRTRRYLEGDPLIREALDHGKVVYERRS
jgi:hypothetical protein